MVKDTGRSLFSTISDVILFAWWYAQGMPELRDEVNKDEKSLQSHEEKESTSGSSFLDDEVQEQLDIIRVLLLRARERKFRFDSLQLQIADTPAENESPREKRGNRINEGNISETEVHQSKSSSGHSVLDTLEPRENPSRIHDMSRRPSRAAPSRSEIPEHITAFFSKIRHRRYDEVTHSLELDPSLSSEPRDEFGNTPLMLAAQARNCPCFSCSPGIHAVIHLFLLFPSTFW